MTYDELKTNKIKHDETSFLFLSIYDIQKYTYMWARTASSTMRAVPRFGISRWLCSPSTSNCSTGGLDRLPSLQCVCSNANNDDVLKMLVLQFAVYYLINASNHHIETCETNYFINFLHVIVFCCFRFLVLEALWHRIGEAARGNP